VYKWKADLLAEVFTNVKAGKPSSKALGQTSIVLFPRLRSGFIYMETVNTFLPITLIMARSLQLSTYLLLLCRELPPKPAQIRFGLLRPGFNLIKIGLACNSMEQHGCIRTPGTVQQRSSIAKA
jgi:hypothetical protein